MIPVLSARVGDNAASFTDVAQLYLKASDLVLDTTYGFGRFWQEVDPMPRVVRMDRHATWDVVADYARLPFGPERFDAVVYDPPYKNGTSHDMNAEHDGYANNSRPERGVKAVNTMYETSVAEAWRVLRPGGVLICKGMDQVESGRTNWFLHSPAMLPSARWEPLDLFVVVRKGRPAMRHPYQIHARKSHSYFVVLRKVAAANERTERLAV
jgi:SAM-dependent methyltransferase